MSTPAFSGVSPIRPSLIFISVFFGLMQLGSRSFGSLTGSDLVNSLRTKNVFFFFFWVGHGNLLWVHSAMQGACRCTHQRPHCGSGFASGYPIPCSHSRQVISSFHFCVFSKFLLLNFGISQEIYKILMGFCSNENFMLWV